VGDFGLVEKSILSNLPQFPDASSRISIAQAPAVGATEHRRNECQNTIGNPRATSDNPSASWFRSKLARCLSIPHLEMKALKIVPRHFADFQLPDERQDVILEIGPIRGDAARLLVGGGIVGHEPSCQVGNRLRLPSSHPVGANVTSERHYGEPLLGDLPGLVDGQLAVHPDRWSALLASPGPIIEEIDATARWRDLQAEPFQVAVPDDDVAVFGCNPFNNALCQPSRHPDTPPR
jgi:hypothetical protein